MHLNQLKYPVSLQVVKEMKVLRKLKCNRQDLNLDQDILPSYSPNVAEEEKTKRMLQKSQVELKLMAVVY